MDKYDGSEPVSSPQKPNYPTFDDISDLYIGQIEHAYGTLLTRVDHAQNAIFNGEILLYGKSDLNGDFVVERLRRIALYGALVTPEDDRIGEFSLSGPLNEVSIDPAQPGEIKDIFLQLHYAELTRSLEPAHQSSDSIVPQTEVISANLNWIQSDAAVEPIVKLKITLHIDKLIDQKLGLIYALSVDPLLITFQLAGSGPGNPMPSHSLQTSCANTGLPCPPGLSTVTRNLRLKFINFSNHSLVDVEQFCNTLIDKVCEVWRNKTGLNIDVATPLVDGTLTEKGNYSDCSKSDESSINNNSYALVNYVEIYIIDSFSPARPGGGITHNGGMSSAYCILQYQANPPVNPYLLAHELGHVLGLEHPDDMLENSGSFESILKAAVPNPSANTLYNCRIFLDSCTTPVTHIPCRSTGCTVTLNPIVQTSTNSDCFNPDPVGHYIGDYPTDLGAEPSSPPSGQNQWSFSNLWNRRSNLAGGLNLAGDPQHEEPFYTDAQNSMFFKLNYLTVVRDPVQVSCFLADPGISPGSAKLIPLAAANTLVINPPDNLSHSITWAPNGLPSGYPKHCCTFAFAESRCMRSLFFNELNLTFADVAPLVLSKRNIAQRNLNIQHSPSSPTPLPFFFPWVQIANPFLEPFQAMVQIDASLAGGLKFIMLEIDDRIVAKFDAGVVDIYQLPEELAPDEIKILRVSATVPAMASFGQEYTVHLSFLLGSAVTGGYSHVLRVVPLNKVYDQVLDSLSGALLHVAVGCKLPTAQDLSEIVNHIRIEGMNNTSWKYELQDLSGRLGDLAMIVQAERIGKQIGLLSTHLGQASTFSDEQFLERLRELADRIQEPAGRLARLI